MTVLDVDVGLIEAISARLDLRAPNKEALESIAYCISQHYDVDGLGPPFEGVVDAATGVGKTFIIAAALEYYAARGHRSFAVIAPGRTILEKTIDNFTAGHAKSLLPGMEVEPLVVTTETFAQMDHAEDDRARLYVFTVQSLTKPSQKQGKKTHEFHESLGEAFYARLQGLDDLIVFADEHHSYYGEVFSAAIRDLEPYALIGLTATPHKKTPPEQLIYRYPLAAAIADRLVKTPVLVGRKDDRSDVLTKMSDGVRLLEVKREAIERYAEKTGKAPVNPVMLVIAQTIADADEVTAIIEDPSFFEGRYANAVLTVHSKKSDEALSLLGSVEDPASPTRIVVSVGMLKEGWDVKNVYVIASLRALVAEILTEQTLGRGLRLPFGEYTDVELLDTLEVLAHERYEALLKKTGVINEAFVDYRTIVRVRTDANGDQSARPETVEVGLEVAVGPAQAPDGGTPVLESLEEREEQARRETEALGIELKPRFGATALRIPRLTLSTVSSSFSINDITELESFEQLGRKLARNPEDELRRTQLGARVVETADGFRRTELVTTTGQRVVSEAGAIPIERARRELVDAILSADVTPGRLGEDTGAERIVDRFLAGLGSKAEEVLSAFLPTASARLVRAVNEEHRQFVGKPQYETLVKTEEFAPTRLSTRDPTSDRTGKFARLHAYTGWKKSMYEHVWFDSSTERALALILDDATEVELWVRLHTGDLKIPWQSDGRQYNPDFVAVEKKGMHWLLETKATKDVESADVKGKGTAAQRWSQRVSADPTVGAEWRYLLVSEDDIEAARGSWAALRGLPDSAQPPGSST